jgi:hypothetical protein
MHHTLPATHLFWAIARCSISQLCGLLVVLLLFSSPAAQEVRPLEVVVVDLATELAQQFPVVSGDVLGVEGEQISLNLGAQDGIAEGIHFEVFREGEALTHPTTGAVIGRVEEALGTVIVVQVFADRAVARRADPTDPRAVRMGDKVRISAGRIALGLLPVTGTVGTAVPSPALEVQLERALEATGRFRPLTADRARIWLLERGLPVAEPLAPALLPELAQTLQVAYVLAPRVQEVQGEAVLEIDLLSPFQAQPIAAPAAVLPESALVQPAPPLPPPLPAPSPRQPVPAPSVGLQLEHRLAWLFKDPRQVQPGTVQWDFTDTLTEIHQAPELLHGLDAGDVDADNQAEIAMVTDTHVRLYRLEDEELKPLGMFMPVPRGSLLSVQLLRLQGTIGLVVNRHVLGKGMDSFVLTLQGQQLVLWREHWPAILLAVDGDGDGVKESVWSQSFDREWFFHRGLVQQWFPGSSAFEQQDEVDFPIAFRATGAALAQLDASEQRELVFVDERQRLRVYRDTEELWRSKPGVGGSYATATLVRFLSNGDTQDTPIFFEGIPAVLDSDGDGAEEVLVARNLAPLRVASFGNILPYPTHVAYGDIALLQHEDNRLTLYPISPLFAGVVSGLAVLPGRTSRVLVAISQRQGFFGHRERTMLFIGHIPAAR